MKLTPPKSAPTSASNPEALSGSLQKDRKFPSAPTATSNPQSLGGSAQKNGIFPEILNKIKKLLGSKTLSDADLMVELEKKAAGKGLNWKISVVDFLKLLGIDSSRENRDALAAELGVPPELESGSAAKNEALRVAVFKKLAENGGNIPGSLLD